MPARRLVLSELAMRGPNQADMDELRLTRSKLLQSEHDPALRGRLIKSAMAAGLIHNPAQFNDFKRFQLEGVSHFETYFGKKDVPGPKLEPTPPRFHKSYGTAPPNPARRGRMRK